MSQVYLVTNLTNGKLYVGKTKQSLVARWRAHLASAARGTRKSILHAAIRVHGVASFKVETLQEFPSEEEALEAERDFVERLGTMDPDRGYNMREGGRQAVGYRPTDETRMNMSSAQVERFARQPMSPETKAKLSAARRGQRPSAETREKMRATHRRRVEGDPILAEELRLRLKRAAKLRVYTAASDETRARSSEAHKKYWAENPPTEEFKAAISDRNRRRGPLSAETKARISASAKAAWARRKKDD